LSAKQQRRSAIGPSEGLDKHTPAAGFQGNSEIGLQAGNCLGQSNDVRFFVFSTVFLKHFQAGCVHTRSNFALDPVQGLDQEKLVSLLSAMQGIMFVAP
jgi:hypothetical protein